MKAAEVTPQGQLRGQLRDSLEALDLNQEVVFQVYSRTVLPLDGFVFWTPLNKVTIKGALHYSRELLQGEDESFGSATVQFSSEQEVEDLTRSPLNRLYVARAGTFRFAFSQHLGFFKQAAVWHYFGHSVQPALEAQLLDEPGDVDGRQPVVSNSLPLWLALNTYTAPYYDGFSNAPPNGIGLTLYPSFLSPPNLVPAYATVHVEPNTRALQAAPYLDSQRNHYQLVADRVRLTMYGLQNNTACDLLDCIEQYSNDTGNFGIMSMSAVVDGVRKQEELMARAMQKFIDFEVSYYQQRVNTVSRQLIKQAQLQITLANMQPPLGVLVTDMGQSISTDTNQPIAVD